MAHEMEDKPVADRSPTTIPFQRKGTPEGRPRGNSFYTPKSGRHTQATPDVRDGRYGRRDQSTYGPSDSSGNQYTSPPFTPKYGPYGQPNGQSNGLSQVQDHGSGTARKVNTPSTGKQPGYTTPAASTSKGTTPKVLSKDMQAGIERLRKAGACTFFGMGRACFAKEKCRYRHIMLKDL